MYDLRRPSGEVPSEIDFLNIVWKPLIHKTTRKEQRRQQKLLRIKKEWYIENIIKSFEENEVKKEELVEKIKDTFFTTHALRMAITGRKIVA